MNQAIHSVDLLDVADGPGGRGPGAERACWPTSGSPSKTSPWPRCAFANGAMGVIEASTADLSRLSEADRNPRQRRLGHDGGGRHRQVGLRQARPSATRRSTQKMAERKSGGGGAADPKAIGHHGHARQFQNVLTAIKKGAKPLVDGPEGRRSVEMILAIYKAAETGRAVKPPCRPTPC